MENHNIDKKLLNLAISVKSVIIDDKNTREHKEDDLNELAESYRMFGQRKPIVANTRGDFPEGVLGKVIAGNGTLEAIRDILRWTHIAVLFVDEDEETAKKYAISDNRTAELSTWNNENMRIVLESMEHPTDIPGMNRTFIEILMEEVDSPLDNFTFEEAREETQSSKVTIIIENSECFGEFLNDLNTLTEMNPEWGAEVRVGG